MHVTVMYSKQAVDWDTIPESECKELIIDNALFHINVFGVGQDVIVLAFDSDQLQKDFKRFMHAGCSFDFSTYTPHVSFSFEKYIECEPYMGTLRLGPEIMEEIDPNWSAKMVDE